MTDDLVDRLFGEAVHLPPVPCPRQAALRWAILLEDALGVVVTDDDITSASLQDPEHVRALLAATTTPG